MAASESAGYEGKIKALFSSEDNTAPEIWLINLYKTILKGIKDNLINRNENMQYYQVFNYIEKLREFFAWIYYLHTNKMVKFNTENPETLDLQGLNTYTLEPSLEPYSEQHVTSLMNIYEIMEQFAKNDQVLYELDKNYFLDLIKNNQDTCQEHPYPGHLVFLKNLCRSKLKGLDKDNDALTSEMFKAYPSSVWMNYPMFFPAGMPRLTEGEIDWYTKPKKEAFPTACDSRSLPLVNKSGTRKKR